jgi:parallel beta-helix repeat protein
MTYTYKLSYRLARARRCVLLGFLAWASACSGDNSSTEEGPTGPGADATPAAIQLTPPKVTAETNQKIRFSGFGRSGAGDSMAVDIEYSAIGGSITSDGVFSASTVGTFKVVGRGKGHTKPDTGVVIVVPPPPNLVAIVVTPDTATVRAGGKQTFAAIGKLRDGSTTAVGVNWTATGGTIDAGGNYTAGSTAGTYKVIATGASSPLADTATVTITPAPATPTLQAVVLTPSTVTLQVGGTQQFTVSGKMSDGSTGSVSVTYTATGGTITASGLYTAGQTSGTFQVIAKQTNGMLADTSAVTIGASTTCTSTATMLCPGDNIQAKANAAGAGATLTLQPGVYRMQSVTPLSSQQFIGQAGAIMSGARVLTGWVQSGATWYVTGQTQQGPSTSGLCQSGYAGCIYPEDLWIDNVLQKHVTSLSAVTTGAWYFDYTADRIYIGVNPAGRMVETSVTPYAFAGTTEGAGSGVTIQGLVIEKYATPAQKAAIGNSNAGSNWIIRDNEVRYNHGIGIHTGDGVQILNNKVHHNGQMGLGGGGGGVRVEGNEIAYNNTAHYDYGWEAGGTKFVGSQNLVARGNFSHHNDGPGLWWDYNNDGALIENNRVEDNVADGIFWEISYSAVIRNNSVSRNGFGRVYSAEGAGITTSSGGAPAGKTLEIYGNTLTGNKNGIIGIQGDRGSGTLGTFLVQNVNVHDNTIQMIAGAKTGIVCYSACSSAVWSGRNNRFTHNTYNLQTADPAPFHWAPNTSVAYEVGMTDSQWKAVGNDATGTFNR